MGSVVYSFKVSVSPVEWEEIHAAVQDGGSEENVHRMKE